MIIKQLRPIPIGAKTACVVRYGAYGDAVFASPVFKRLKEQGYYVFFNCTERCYEVNCKNPNIDCFWILESNEVPAEELEAYWEKLKKPFTRFINLNGTIEEKLLLVPWDKDYTGTKEEVDKRCNKNYMDATMEAAGFPELKGEQPELFFKKREEDWAAAIRKKYPGFLVAYSLSGSSPHKTYPYAGEVIQAIVDGLPDATVLLLGEEGCRNIIDPHPRVVDMCGQFGIRRSYILTKIADLVISTETSIANAASCFDTPKIILLSHSSNENLTKYWRNCLVVEPNVSCFPCHRLHYSKASCPLDATLELPICASLTHPAKILDKVEQVYGHWKQQTTLKD